METRPLSDDEAARDWVEWPLPPIDRKDAKRLLEFEDDAAIASFRGVLVFRLKERALWAVKALLAFVVTSGPLAAADRKGRPWTRSSSVRAAAATLAYGYPSWVPRRLGVYD